MRHLTLIAAIGLASASFQGQAAIIDMISHVPAPQVTVDFNDQDGLIIAPGQSYTAGVPTASFSSVEGTFTVGQRLATDLGINGSWGAGKSFLSFDTIGDMTLRIDFSGLKTRAFVADWSLYEEDGDHRLFTVTAFGIDGSSESFTLGAFAESLDGIDLEDNELRDSVNFSVTRGIRLRNADIAYITITGDGVVMDNFAYTAPVPEPESWAMLLAGLGLVGFTLRSRRQSA